MSVQIFGLLTLRVEIGRRGDRASSRPASRSVLNPSSGRQWRNHPLDFCKKGAVAEEMVEQYDVPADSADAVHLVDNGQRIRDDTGHLGGVHHIE